MRVTMIGAGYVGLVSGACFADFGHHVTCVDKDAGRIAALRRGEIPIFEPGLADLVATNMAQERLSFSPGPTASTRPTRSSSRSARRRAAAMVTPI
jgi:UDPglucose 6-dehydrogenase